MNAQLVNSAPVRFDYASGIASGGCSDLDMVWERHKQFLVIENKLPDEELSLGQLYCLRSLSSYPMFTVWVVRGFPPSDVQSFGVLDGPQVEASVDDVRGAIQAWWDSH